MTPDLDLSHRCQRALDIAAATRREHPPTTPRTSPVPRLPRRKIPDRIGLIVALRQLGFAKPELDHDPALGLRPRTEDGKYVPDEHDPDYLVWRDKDEHAVKTRGNGATTAGSDIHAMAKVRRLSREQEDFQRRLLAKAPGAPIEPKRKSPWPKRSFGQWRG